MDVWFRFVVLVFFSKKDYLVFPNYFPGVHLKKTGHTHILDQRNFLKSLQTRSHYFNLFLFRKLSYYKTISGYLAKPDNTPKEHFIYKMPVFPKTHRNL